MPDFGRSLLSHWWLDPAQTYLNHGTAGATPRVVLEAQQSWQREIERAPARALFRDLLHWHPADAEFDAAHGRPRSRLRAVREEVAAFVGARGEDLVLVDNATTGINAVLRSLVLAPGDEILVLDQAYGAVARAAGFVAGAAGARVAVAPLPWPVAGDAAAVARACADAVERALTPRTRLAVLDHVASESGLVLPLAEMAARCRARGVPVLADGAHAPGALALDLPSLGVDWYVGNLHKWAFAPRACGLLWASPRRQAGLHPAVVSWGLGEGFEREFDWTGTRDPSALLAIPAALAFMRETLGVTAMRAWNHGLAWRMAGALARRWGVDWRVPEAMVGCMAAVPLPARVAALGAAAAPRLKDWLLRERAIEAQVLAIHGVPHVRLAAQVYNDEDDFERLAAAVEAWQG